MIRPRVKKDNNMSALSISTSESYLQTMANMPHAHVVDAQQQKLNTKIDSLIKNFINSLKNNYVNTQMVLPSLGSSGCTYLCTMGSSSISEPISEKIIQEFSVSQNLAVINTDKKVIKFVLKLLSHDQADNEQACSNFLKQWNLSTPNIYKLEDLNIQLNLLKPMKALHNQFPPGHGNAILQKHSIIVMPAFQAATLSSLIKEKRLLLLQDEDIQKLGESFGEIAIFDLLIGNTDRLIRFNSDGKLLYPEINAGNIMVELESVNEQKIRIKNVHFIDNSTDSFMIDKCDDTEEDDESENQISLFAEENSQDDDYLSSPKTRTPSISADQRAEGFKQAFEDLTKDLITIHQHIYDGTQKCLLKAKQTKEEDQLIEHFLKIFSSSLDKGFKKAIDKLKQPYDNKAQSLNLFDEYKTKFADRLKNLIEANLSTIVRRT